MSLIDIAIELKNTQSKKLKELQYLLLAKME